MAVEAHWKPVPGIRYLPGYIDLRTQESLLSVIDSHRWQNAGERRVQFWGCTYTNQSRNIQRTGGLPPWARDVAVRLKADDICPVLADQLIVTEYQPGQGIFSHVDAPMFADTIVTISLGSTCMMEFVAPEAGQHEHLLLEPLSALVLSGDGRNTWSHLIPARTSDVWQGRTWKRTRRVSLSFRKVL